MNYDHKKIEQKWQKKWEQGKCFQAEIDHNRPKFYALDMFPYPSGAGLHIGHLASYTPTEVVARYKRAQGFNVLHPIGYDAFGLPAEQHAIKTGVHPEKVTQESIQNFRRQLKSFGYSFDWNRELSTCDPGYYKWTQYIFKVLFKKNLVYQDEAPVNWCPALKTVLANEEVVDGKSERGGHEVFRVFKKQWMLKITDYCEKLLQGLNEIDWLDRTKAAQRNWIGKSEGLLLNFDLCDCETNPDCKTNSDCETKLQIFTTRPDTLFGVSYMVIAPEHPLLEKITTKEQKQVVEDYKQACMSVSEVSRKTQKEKTGVWTGAFVCHPITGNKIPVWTSDYVLMDYGTGCVMAVPAHDERDFEFAKKFDLPILPVLEHKELPFTGDGKHINSENDKISINGLDNKQACKKIMDYLEGTKQGSRKIQYKLRDWLFSRQRYWGEPIPLIHTKDSKVQAVPDEELPVELPKTADYEPSEKGEPPLARIKEFMDYKNGAQRDANTMPSSAGSSWYFLRYTDPHNDKKAFDFEAQKYWMPVDLYVGGAEHSVGHLLYSRFWQRVLYDAGLVSHPEPFKKLVHQGSILGSDGFRMSKTRGNGVSPDDVREKYGADVARLYICFLGPFDKDKPWSDKGIEGCSRFVERVWRYSIDSKGKSEDLDKNLESVLHQTIKKVGSDIESLDFNTAISALMILVNELYKVGTKNEQVAKILSQLLMPFSPHVAEEIWENLGEKDFVSLASWPKYDENKIQSDECTIGVQVNGKTKGSITISKTASEEEALSQAKELSAVQNLLKDKKIKKCIYKPAKILN